MNIAREILEKTFRRAGTREKVRRLFGKGGITEDYARKCLPECAFTSRKQRGYLIKLEAKTTVKYYRDGRVNTSGI
jgi:hypothetical protein